MQQYNKMLILKNEPKSEPKNLLTQKQQNNWFIWAGTIFGSFLRYSCIDMMSDVYSVVVIEYATQKKARLILDEQWYFWRYVWSFEMWISIRFTF